MILKKLKMKKNLLSSIFNKLMNWMFLHLKNISYLLNKEKEVLQMKRFQLKHLLIQFQKEMEKKQFILLLLEEILKFLSI